MFVTGPDVIKTVTHEEVTKEDLGGAITHNSKSGVAHFAAENDEQAMMMLRELFSFLPSNNMEDPPIKPCTDDIHREDEHLQTIVPDDPNKPYDMKEIINTVVDEHNFFEVMRAAALLPKARLLDPGVVPAAIAWTMATQNGARALGFDELGTLAPGNQADLLLISAAAMLMAPASTVIKIIFPLLIALLSWHVGRIPRPA